MIIVISPLKLASKILGHGNIKKEGAPICGNAIKLRKEPSSEMDLALFLQQS